MKYTLYIMLLSLIYACSEKKQREEIIPIEIERIDLALLDSTNTIEQLNQLQPGFDMYVSLMNLDSPDRENSLTTLRNNRITTIFGQDIKERFIQTDSLSQQLGRTVKNLACELPGITVSHIYGIASPYMQSVFINDSIVMIALNHYLGPDYPGYTSMPTYIKEKKRASQIPADIAEALVRVEYPYIKQEGTLLEHLLYEGAVMNAMSRSLENNKAEAIGYEICDESNENTMIQQAWHELIVNNMLYTTDIQEISRMLNPPLYCRIGSLEMPRYIYRLLGHRVIDSYLRHNPGTTIERLLTPDFYGHSQKRLIESKFNAG